jgi:hypothetical protein
MSNPANLKAIEKLFAPEVSHFRSRFGDDNAQVVLAHLENRFLAGIDGLTARPDYADTVEVGVDWPGIERDYEAALAKSASVASLELRLAPEDRAALLGAVSALGQRSSKLTVQHNPDGSVGGITREVIDTGATMATAAHRGDGAPNPKPASRPDREFWNNQVSGGGSKPPDQTNDERFWAEQNASPRQPQNLPASGSTSRVKEGR